jgi:hypothetical protein
MLIPALPLDYAELIDVTDRSRRTRTRASGSRIRRDLERGEEARTWKRR